VERSEDDRTAVTVQQAAWVLGIMGSVFKVIWLCYTYRYITVTIQRFYL
jgi:hypothetical protein